MNGAAIQAWSLRWLCWNVLSLIGVFLICSTTSTRVAAQTSRPSQVDVQSVYLFDFTKFVRWTPESAPASLRLCVAGGSSYVESLKKVVAGESIDGKPLGIVPTKDPAEVSGCSILFIDVTERNRIDSLLAAASGHAVLTVSDAPDFLNRGGMIQFVNVANHVRFAVNLQAVQHSGLTMSSELLKVAVSVTGKSGGVR